jgi:hypothetical protein
MTQRIRIDEGAVLRGSVEIQRAEKSSPMTTQPAPAEVQKSLQERAQRRFRWRLRP